MDLRDALKGLVSRLPEESDFTTDNKARPGDGTARSVAAANAESVYPLTVFVDWVERCPEARDMLAQYGLGWGSGSSPRQEIRADDGLPGGGCAFRARLGDRWQNVVLLDVVGPVLKVRVVGAPNGHMTAIQLSQVSPVDLPRVQEAVKGYPGASCLTFFDDDAGATRAPDGQVVTPVLPPPAQ